MNHFRTLAGNRLKELRKERESGLTQLAAMEQRVDDLKQTLLRIGGAIQVLEELERDAEPQKTSALAAS